MVSGNSATRTGAGIDCFMCSPTIANCTFTGNTSQDGAGIFCYTSSPTITNCTFSVNHVQYVGSGLYASYSSSPILTNCTFSGNTEGIWGGIYYVSSSPVLINCILWGSRIFSYDSNVLSVTYSNIQGGYAGQGNINLDPLFADVAAGDLRLQPMSPCIDMGNNSAPSLPAKDKLGANRIIDGNGDGNAIVDMGAYEYPGTPTVVRLLSFRATAGADGMAVARWRTASETDTAGFHLWRSRLRNGKYVRLTGKIIPARGDTLEGARYRFDDLTAMRERTYFYKLEDVDVQGRSTFHGPVRLLAR